MLLCLLAQATEHPHSEELEAYALGRSPDSVLERIQGHLLTCERCQEDLARTAAYILAIKQAAASFGEVRRLCSIHITEDGPIFGTMHPRSDGKWLARHWGRQLDGGRVCDSVEDANAYLLDSFHQMFPEHTCSEQCNEELM